MAKYRFAHVYFQDHLAGSLKEGSGDQIVFRYEESYLDANLPAIASTLPLQKEPFISLNQLHPFFDNLVSEGWMEAAQTRLLGQRQVSRFELLIAFGKDCAGAVYIVDPEPIKKNTDALLDLDNPMEMAILSTRASLSGIQPKLPLVKDSNTFRPARSGELSTYIGKCASPKHSDIILNEYLSTQAFKTLLTDDQVVDLNIGKIEGIHEPALIIKRFDRLGDHKRIHFEEFNQLLGRISKAKYNGHYEEMADFIATTPRTLKAEMYTLFLRILAGILIGNTDMHLKNFAMFHTPKGLRLTPAYDQVAAALYQYKEKINPKQIIRLGKSFKLNSGSIRLACKTLEKNLSKAKDAIQSSTLENDQLKTQLINFMEKRWNGTFALIGQHLSKKQ